MKPYLNENLTNIRNFFKLCYYEENATREEIINFLNECLKYVLTKNDLNINDFNVQIHFVSSKELGDAEAKVFRDEKHANTYDVLFNKRNISFKRFSEEESGKFFSFVYYAMHEFSHIVQYSTKRDEALEAELYIQDLYDSIEALKELPHCKGRRLLLKSLKNHLVSQEYMCDTEKDANEQAYYYFSSILQQLIPIEEDEEFVNFLYALYQFIDDIKLDNNFLYKKYGLINHYAVKNINKNPYYNA